MIVDFTNYLINTDNVDYIYKSFSNGSTYLNIVFNDGTSISISDTYSEIDKLYKLLKKGD